MYVLEPSYPTFSAEELGTLADGTTFETLALLAPQDEAPYYLALRRAKARLEGPAL